MKNFGLDCVSGAARAGACTALRLMAALSILATTAPALAQDTTPDYSLFCTDCTGTEYFGELLPGDTDNCQSYQQNSFENWTAEGTTSPDAKFVRAAQSDIVEVNQASDATFWYYQVVTRATSWSSVQVQSLNLEMAFGDCSLATTRFNLLLSYTVAPADAGATWKQQGDAQVKYYRDTSAGNDRIGDVTNDGPATPVGNTSNFDSNDDGYNSDVVVAATDTYTRLHVDGGNATIEFAIRRTTAALLAVANPFTPCFGRAWTGQSSTISKDQFAINDQRPTSDFTSTSWAIDNCTQAASADPCDPAPDCTAFGTACGIASCDPAGADGNCGLLTPRTAGFVCRADAGACDVAETCDGASTGACPVNAFEPAASSCGSSADSICDNPDTCNGSGSCVANNEPNSVECRADVGACDVAESCDGAGACPADAFEPAATPCGSPNDSVCDNPDSCDATGTCLTNNEPGTTECRSDAGDCDVAESCDGAGVCPGDGFEPAATPCGSDIDTICDNADTCNATGTCLANHEPGTVECRADAGDCDVAESCDGAGACPADAFEPVATPCGSDSDTICDNADTCNATGTCLTNHEPGTTECRGDAGECDVAESCDGVGACPADTFEPVDTACGSPDDSICDSADSCNATGTCMTNVASDTVECRADAGDCDVAETCDGAGACPADAFEPVDTACGSPDDTVCDNADTCNATGTCLANNEPGTTECRADQGECDVAESCDGAGACPANAFEPVDTVCGSPDETVCDNADTCNATGTCLVNNEPDTTECRADQGECDVAESCDGAGACPADAFEPVDTACGSPDDTVCDNADTCNATGTCLVNNEADTVECRADQGECDVAESCDGAGACPADAFEPAATPCGDGTDAICSNPDSCDAGGICVENNEPIDVECRPDAGACDVAESCDGAGTCPADVFEPVDTACGNPGDTICDDPDTCDAAGTCLVNNAPGTTECRIDAGDCDVAESCDGAGACPADAFEPAATPCGDAGDTICDNPNSCDSNGGCVANNEPDTTECRAIADDCDVAESCDGAGSCPADGFASSLTECRAIASPCDQAETCTGAAAECPADAPATVGTECRAVAGGCDIAETCDGSSFDCGVDEVQPLDVACRPSAGICDVAESCDGVAASCPIDGFEASTVECRAPADICDTSESCTGLEAQCPADSFEPASTVCRASTAACDATETCTGAGVECPADTDLPNGSPCEDNTVCTTADSCVAGECQPGGPLDCDDGDLCTINSCDAQTGCVNDPWIRDEESCHHSAAGRLVVANRSLTRKDSIRWTWRKGEVTTTDLFGTPGAGTGYSLCIFDQSGGVPRLATSLAIPPDAPYWKPLKASRLRYIDRPGTFDGVRRIRLQAKPVPLKSRVIVRAKGSMLPLPEPAADSSLFNLDPTLVVQFVNDEEACWSSEFTPGDSKKNTSTIYRGSYR